MTDPCQLQLWSPRSPCAFCPLGVGVGGGVVLSALGRSWGGACRRGARGLSFSGCRRTTTVVCHDHAVPAAVRGRLARAGHLDSHKPSIGPPESMQGRQLLGTERAKTYDDIVDGARDKRGLDTVPTSAHTVIWTDRHVVVPLALGSRSITTSFPGSGQQGWSILSGANAPAKGRRRCRSPTTRVWHHSYWFFFAWSTSNCASLGTVLRLQSMSVHKILRVSGYPPPRGRHPDRVAQMTEQMTELKAQR